MRKVLLVVVVVATTAGGGFTLSANGAAEQTVRACASAWNASAPKGAPRMMAARPTAHAYVTTAIASSTGLNATTPSCAILFGTKDGQGLFATGIWSKGVVAKWVYRWLKPTKVVAPPPNASVSGDWIVRIEA